jgi:hypothetical protein
LAKVATAVHGVWRVNSKEATSNSGQLERGAEPGWPGTALIGIAPVAVAAMLVVLFGFLDGLHYASLEAFLMPDPTAAAGALAMAGGVEGVTISIVICRDSLRHPNDFLALFASDNWHVHTQPLECAGPGHPLSVHPLHVSCSL